MNWIVQPSNVNEKEEGTDVWCLPLWGPLIGGIFFCINQDLLCKQLCVSDGQTPST